MKKDSLFPGSFIIHPLSLFSVLVIIFNDFYIKPSKNFPLIAGKLSDIFLMIFLPIFLSFIFVFIKYLINSILIIFKKDLEENYKLPYFIIIISIIISGSIMILLQTSDWFNLFFQKEIIILKEFFSNRKYYNINLTKDLYDLISIPFLIIPYLFLKRR